MIEACKLEIGELFRWQDGIYQVVEQFDTMDNIIVVCIATYVARRGRWVARTQRLQEKFNGYCPVSTDLREEVTA